MGGREVVIETPRLLVRVPHADDAPAYCAIHADPDVTRWLGGVQPNSVDEEVERIRARRAEHEESGLTLWTVEERSSHEVVGLAGVFPVEKKGPDVEVAYHFRKDRWGRGYATETAGACVDYGFSTAGLDRIVGLVAPGNVASKRVLEKCGLTYSGPAHHYGMDLLRYTIDRPPGD